MVPFPDIVHDEEAGEAARGTTVVLGHHYPDWKGLVMPPLKEIAKRDLKFWERVYKPDYIHSAETPKDQWAFGALRVMLRTLLLKKHRVDPDMVDLPIDAALEHISYKRDDWRKRIYVGMENVELDKAIRDAENEMRRLGEKYGYTEEAIKDFKRLFPVALEGAKALGKFFSKWAEMYKDEVGRMPSPEDARALLEDKEPRLDMPLILELEEIMKIHAAHTALYDIPDEKRLSRMMFKKRSGVDELLEEEEKTEERPETLHSRKPLGEKVNVAQNTPESALREVKLEILPLLKAVELVGSQEVRSKATEELREKVREIANGKLSEEALLKAGLYTVAAELIALGKDEKLKELLDRD